MHPALTIAVAAARKAGEVLMQYREHLDKIQVHQKAYQDLYSEVDVRAEQLIIQTLLKAFPDHGILAEESDAKRLDAESIWIIDPLDGTTNYLHEYPFFCVSIALKTNNRLECGVVLDPLRQECFVAARGEGARLNDRRLRVSKRADLTDALLGTTFSFSSTRQTPAFKTLFQDAASVATGFRRHGAAALELAYVAAGRLEGFLGGGLHEWDMAAGALLVQEAGGIVSGLSGQEDYLDSGHILAANPKIFKALIEKGEARG